MSDLENLPLSIPKNCYFLINVTKNENKGVHWIVIKNLKGRIIMFDSFDLSTRILPKPWSEVVVKSDDCVFQNKESTVCGQYCALFILEEKLMSIFKCTSPNSKKSVKNDVLCLYMFQKLNKILQ